jgi:membrane protein YdbS with pleckstrin-like domain
MHEDRPVSEHHQRATAWKWVALTAALIAAIAAVNDLWWQAVVSAAVMTCAFVWWAGVFVRYHQARFHEQEDQRDGGPPD